MSGQKKRVGRYPVEVRERAVRMVREHEHEYPSQWKAIESISKKLGINHETHPTFSGRMFGDVGHPQLVRAVAVELSIDQIVSGVTVGIAPLKLLPLR